MKPDNGLYVFHSIVVQLTPEQPSLKAVTSTPTVTDKYLHLSKLSANSNITQANPCKWWPFKLSTFQVIPGLAKIKVFHFTYNANPVFRTTLSVR